MIKNISSFAKENWHWMLLSIIMFVVLASRIYHVSDYPFHEDEIGSIGVMRSIVSSGLPLTGDEFYWRALLAHYLMAFPLFFMDVSPLSTRIMCILMSVFLLPAVFSAGCRLRGRLAGLLAVCVLCVSSYENLYASFARFYLPQQFFFVWALLLAYIYFVEGDKKKGLWLFLAVAGTLATHKLGVMIWLPQVLAFLLGRQWGLFKSTRFILALAFLLLETYFLGFWVPAGAYQNHFAPALEVGSLDDKLIFARVLRDFLPGVWGGTALGFAALCLDKTRRKAWLFFFMVFAMTFLIVSCLAPDESPRYAIQVFALAAIIATAGLAWLVSELVNYASQQSSAERRLHRVFVVGVVVIVSGLVSWHVDRYNWNDAFGYGFHFLNQKPAHDFLASRMSIDDILISSDPDISRFYLRERAVYFLRQKIDSKTETYGPFPENLKIGSPEYYIDSIRQLQKVLSTAKGKVWLYANWKLEWAIGPRLDFMIRRNFQLVYKNGETWVLVNSPQMR